MAWALVGYGLTAWQWLFKTEKALSMLSQTNFVIFITISLVVAGPEIRSSMQALIFAATVGVGLFLGTQAAGIVMDQFYVDGRFQWRKIWVVPCLTMAAGVAALIVLFAEG